VTSAPFAARTKILCHLTYYGSSDEMEYCFDDSDVPVVFQTNVLVIRNHSICGHAMRASSNLHIYKMAARKC